MQKMLYDDAPYIVTVYYDNLEAYRTDRFTGFQPQPDPDGSCCSSTAPTATSNIATREAAADSSATAASAGARIGAIAASVVGGRWC